MRTRTTGAYGRAVPLGLVSDIHGNAVALERVVAELDRLGIERVVCLGDVAQGGPQPREVLDRLDALGWLVILGNADDYLVGRHAEDVPENTNAVRDWSRSQLDDGHVEQICAFAPTLEVELDGGLRLRAFHGSPASYEDVILPETPDGQVESLLGGSGVDVLAGGHTHTQWTRYVDGALYVNPGSVGAAYDRHQPVDDFRYTPVAEYGVVTGAGVEFRRVAYDLDEVIAAGRDAGWPHWALETERWRTAS
jgi:predicted phosphodiesterase